MTPHTVLRATKSILIALAIVAFVPSLPAQEEEEAGNDPVLQDYFLGNGSYNRKLYTVAITYYEAFLKAHADHAKADLARRGLALSFYALKQYEKAMPPLTALLAKDDLDPSISRERLVMLQGQCLMLTGKKDEAQKLFVAEMENLKTDTYRAGALAAVCDVSFGKSDWKEVQSWSGQLLAAKPTPEQAARGNYQLGYALYQLKDPDAAIAALGKIAGLEADKSWKTRADYLLGECYNLKEEYDKAEASFVAALPGLEGKDAVECRYRIGLTRFVLKKYAEALTDLEAHLVNAKDGPNAPQAKLYIARAQLELKDYDKAKVLLEELGAGDDETAARASLWLARVHTRKGDSYAVAAEALGQAVAKFKDSTVTDDLQFDYANALMARDDPDWKTALDLLQGIEARGSFPQMAEVLSQRAVCQHKLGDYAGSLASNDAFLGKHPDHALAANAHFMRAENLFLLNRLDEAAVAYGEFGAKHADNSSAQAANYRLAQIHHDQGRWAECLAIAGPMLAKHPEGRLYAQLPFLVGDCEFRLEKWPEAIKSLQEFVTPRLASEKGRAEPNVDTALMQLAVAHDRLDQEAEALKDLAILVNDLPGSSPQLPLALAEQGRLAFEVGDRKLARKALEKFIALDAADAEPFKNGAPAQRPRVMYYLGWIEADEGNHEAASKRFGEVLKLDPNSPLVPDAALQEGVAWVNAGNFEAAAKHFTEMLARHPKHEKLARLVYYAGLSLARQEQWDPAKAQFKRVVQEFGESEFADQALYEWAWCERRSKHNEEAIKLYDQLLASYAASPLAVKVQSELAELNLESGAQDKVITQLTGTLEKVKDPALREDIRYQLATAHFSKGDHKTAAAQFEQLLADYPDSKLLASILFQAGESRLKLGETAPARDHFAKAAVLPGLPGNLAESVAMRLAETQALTNQHAAAQTSYLAFLEKFPESRWKRNAQFGLAFALESAGESEKAIPEYQKLLTGGEVDLWTVRGRYQLGECRFNLQQYEDAVGEFVNVEINYKQYPDWQAKAVLEMARVLMAQKKNDQAAERLKDLITRYPDQKAATVAQQYLDELRSK